MRKEVISARGITKYFGEFPVLDHITFNLYLNENLVLLGKSGAGKSVLLKTLIGLIEPDEGTIQILGKNLMETSENELFKIRKKVGYLFQGGALYDFMTVRENLEFAISRQVPRKPKEEIENAVVLSLEKVGLKNVLNKLPSELSGGMKKRAALARCLILEPQIMLYDEPTTGLDPVTSKEINMLIIEMRDKYGISSITVTHDPSTFRMTADRILVLQKGKIVAEGIVNDLEKSENEYVRGFFE